MFPLNVYMGSCAPCTVIVKFACLHSPYIMRIPSAQWIKSLRQFFAQSKWLLTFYASSRTVRKHYARSLTHPCVCAAGFFSVSFHFIRWVGSVWLPSFCFTSTFLFCCLWNSFHHGTFCIKCTILSTDTNTHTWIPEFMLFFADGQFFPLLFTSKRKTNEPHIFYSSWWGDGITYRAWNDSLFCNML